MRQLHRQKAADFQVAAQIAHGYSRIFSYSPEQAKECQKLSAVAARAARRHLWALLDPATDAPVEALSNAHSSQLRKCTCDSPKPSARVIGMCIICGGFYRI